MRTTPETEGPLGFLKLVAHPHRWRILSELARSDRRVGELCALVGSPQNLVSYHLRELREGGLVTARQSSADRRDTYYRAAVARCAELLGATGAALHPGARLGPVPLGPAVRRATPGVLFLCTGNSARSQMAEALLTARTEGAIGASSAGSHPKPLHPLAVEVMAERGIYISARRSTHVDRVARERFAYVVTLCDKVREVCPELPGRPATAHWSMADPSAAEGGAREAFARTADEIEDRVALLVSLIDDDLRREESSHGSR